MYRGLPHLMVAQQVELYNWRNTCSYCPLRLDTYLCVFYAYSTYDSSYNKGEYCCNWSIGTYKSVRQPNVYVGRSVFSLKFSNVPKNLRSISFSIFCSFHFPRYLLLLPRRLLKGHPPSFHCVDHPPSYHRLTVNEVFFLTKTFLSTTLLLPYWKNRLNSVHQPCHRPTELLSVKPRKRKPSRDIYDGPLCSSENSGMASRWYVLKPARGVRLFNLVLFVCVRACVRAWIVFGNNEHCLLTQ